MAQRAYDTLGESLFARGYVYAQWYPDDAFEEDPPKKVLGYFEPWGVEWDDMDVLGSMDKRWYVEHGSNDPPVSKAKGAVSGAWDGRKYVALFDPTLPQPVLDAVLDDLSLKSLVIDRPTKEDLKYVCNASGLTAYMYLQNLVQKKWDEFRAMPSTPFPSNQSSPSPLKSPIPQRLEEIRTMIRDLGEVMKRGGIGESGVASMPFLGSQLLLLTEEPVWSALHPFVEAALLAYRRIMQ